MAAITHKKDYTPMTMGLNSRFTPPALNELEMSVAQNVQVNNSGTIEKYPGYIKDGSPFPNSSDSFIRTIFDFKRGASTDLLLIAASDAGNTNGTYKVDIKSTIGDGTYQYISYGIGTAAFTNSNTAVTGTNTSWTHELKPGDKIKLAADPDADYTEIATVNSDTSITLVGGGYLGTTHAAAAYSARKIWNNNNVPRFTTFNSVAIIVDGDGIPQQYDGTNIFGLINSYSGTTITVAANAAPVGKYVTTHKNRVFMAAGSTIYWSHANDQTFWDPASTEPIFPQDGGDIISIVSFADSLICLKSNGKVYRVFGNFDDSAAGTVAYIVKIDYPENVGLIADRSCFVHGAIGNQQSYYATNSLYFLAETGVYSINPSGYMQRLSFLIEPTTKTFNFSAGAQTSKSFPFTTKTQWDSGTNSGTRALQPGIIGSFFDDFRQTDAKQAINLLSCCIGTDNAVHVAYVLNSAPTTIEYVRYQFDGTIRKEATGATSATGFSPSNISVLSIGVSAADQTVGIAYNCSADDNLMFIERTPDTGSNPIVYGTWGTPVNVANPGFGITAISSLYSPGGVPSVGFAGNGHADYAQRNSGVWVINTVDAVLSTNSTIKVAITLDGSGNIYYVTNYRSNSFIGAFKSTNGGATWSTIDYFLAPAIDAPSGLFTFVGQETTPVNISGHMISVYTSGGAIIKRDHTAATTTTLVSGSNNLCVGYLSIYQTFGLTTPLNQNVNYIWNNVGSSPSQQETFTFETSNTLQNPNSNVIQATQAGTNIYTSSPSFSNNGQTIAMCAFGTNANEIVVRRISFYGNWSGPEQHDATLTAWGTYVVTGQISNGNTIQHQIALASAHPASSFNNINSGSVISSNTALIYNIPRFIFTLLAWAGVQITSIVLNYTGAGIDSRQAFGLSFYNEAYFAVSTTGASTNNKVLVYDIKGSPILATYSVNCMDRFKTNLYAGSATNGDLYVLKQNFDYNGSSYNMDVQTKEDFMGSLELQKDFYKIYVLFNVQTAGNFIFSYRFDNFITPGGAAWVDSIVDQTTNGIYEVPLGGTHARSIQYRIQNQNAGQSVQVLGFTTVYGILDRR